MGNSTIKINFRSRPELKPFSAPWITGQIQTPAGAVSKVSTKLAKGDISGSWKARWGIGRMKYTVPAGLYATGQPDTGSPVFASANYKMSFDRLRFALDGINSWIIVLDTLGINVWCAAGKGTFGTDELIRVMRMTDLNKVISHKRIIAPQLGAPGINANEIRSKTGFNVRYGPVRAEDIKQFMQNNMKATPDMRLVKFPLKDRAVLIPIELVQGAKPFFISALILAVLSGLAKGGFSAVKMAHDGLISALFLLMAFSAGAIVVPLLLPWIPFRAFSIKGALSGICTVAIALFAFGLGGNSPFANNYILSAWIFIFMSVSSFTAMNFTGASTFTSISGVRREMRYALPAQIASAALGLLAFAYGHVI